ncbi:MAG: hypothetical protein KBE94_02740 [Paludibacteraceae bacterium]|nr:hypothetical protein [Paludibacteraceae bacterium]
MPYRRLPNTDAARLRALRAVACYKNSPIDTELPFDRRILQEICSFLPQFENAMFEYKQAINSEGNKNNKYQQYIKNVRLYISHFIQVLNLACIRNEIKPEKKLLYKLLPDNYAVPDLSTETLLIEWGKNIIQGENERTRAGSSPIYNPTIAKVQVHYDIFKEAYHSKKVAQKNVGRYAENMQKMRMRADEIILDAWNQIEQAFVHYGMDEMQQKAKEFGIVYYLRRKERQAMAKKSH